MQFDISKTWCFTGHRPNGLYGYSVVNPSNIKLKVAIRDAVLLLYLNHGITTFISGMAEGWDLWGADIVIALKHTYPELKLICAIPCKNQSDKFSKEYKEIYDYVLDNADYIHNVTGIKYFPRCMQISNEWMVNNSIGQIAGFDGTRGGTFNCIQYANKVNKTNRIIIHPQTFNVSMIGI